MRFEHFAINVAEPVAMAAWYSEHLDMHAVVANQEPPYAHFLADSSGRVVIEIYHNPDAPLPDYANQHPAVVHHAFAVDDPKAEATRLIAAGASWAEEIHDDSLHLITLRDPWGLPLQVCRRATPMP